MLFSDFPSSQDSIEEYREVESGDEMLDAVEHSPQLLPSSPILMSNDEPLTSNNITESIEIIDETETDHTTTNSMIRDR